MKMIRELIFGIKAVNFMNTRTGCEYYDKFRFIEDVVEPYVWSMRNKEYKVIYAVNIRTLDEYVYVTDCGDYQKLICISADSNRAIMQDVMQQIR